MALTVTGVVDGRVGQYGPEMCVAARNLPGRPYISSLPRRPGGGSGRCSWRSRWRSLPRPAGPESGAGRSSSLSPPSDGGLRQRGLVRAARVVGHVVRRVDARGQAVGGAARDQLGLFQADALRGQRQGAVLQEAAGIEEVIEIGGVVGIADAGGGWLGLPCVEGLAGHRARLAGGVWDGLPCLTRSGAFGGDDDLVEVLAGRWYVNVMTEKFPDGEIRGQILPLKK